MYTTVRGFYCKERIYACRQQGDTYLPDLLTMQLLALLALRDHQNISKQEVWPPGTADMVCPRRPIMTPVQHWAKTAH